MCKIFFIIFFLVMTGACAADPSAESLAAELIGSETVLLAVDRYGYIAGDIVRVDPKTQPKDNDIIVFDHFKNKSDCFASGFSMGLGKVTGLPGESIAFRDNNLIIRGQVIPDSLPQLARAIFGAKIYQDLENVDIVLQEGEYLADKMIGQECSGFDEHGSSVSCKRFTVNKEALIGVVVGKAGHDDKAEQFFKNVQY